MSNTQKSACEEVLATRIDDIIRSADRCAEREFPNVFVAVQSKIKVAGQLTDDHFRKLLSICKNDQQIMTLGRVLFPEAIGEDQFVERSVEQLVIYAWFLLARSAYLDAIRVLVVLQGRFVQTTNGVLAMEATVMMGECLRKVGKYEECADLLGRVLESMGHTPPDVHLQHRALAIEGKALVGLGDHDGSLRSFEAIIKQMSPRTLVGRDTAILVDAYRGKNIVLRDRGHYNRALADAVEIQDLVANRGHTLAEGYIARTLSTCHKMLGHFVDASNHNRFAHECALSLGHLSLQANCIWGQAEIYRYRGDFEIALSEYEAAIKAYEQIFDQQGLLYCHLGKGDIFLKKRMPSECIESYRRADQLALEGHCALESLYVRAGQVFIQGIGGPNIDIASIVHIVDDAKRMQIAWLQILLELTLLYCGADLPSVLIDERKADFEAEFRFVNAFRRNKAMQSPPYLDLPQKF
jgi:tetratricopeptide (TPR) repeat protein